MKFLVNPECYHKMCESCVDRIFSHGPAPCPIAGCARTLRKGKFREATFEDLKVEREVDIRRRVASMYDCDPTPTPTPTPSYHTNTSSRLTLHRLE
jgi:CDK-activating kinase assembly factor MAT1